MKLKVPYLPAARSDVGDLGTISSRVSLWSNKDGGNVDSFIEMQSLSPMQDVRPQMETKNSGRKSSRRKMSKASKTSSPSSSYASSRYIGKVYGKCTVL